MSTQPAFSMPAGAGKTCQPTHQPPRIHRFFGASGTVQEWVEDGVAVLAGVATFVVAALILAHVAVRR